VSVALTGTCLVTACEACGREIGQKPGYLLGTQQVTREPAYWRLRFQRAGGDHERAALEGVVRRETRKRSAWVVCADCVRVFRVDRELAHTLYTEWCARGRPAETMVPGGGTGSYADGLSAARQAWVGAGRTPPLAEKKASVVELRSALLFFLFRLAGLRPG
jgi:hypothetical protein